LNKKAFAHLKMTQVLKQLMIQEIFQSKDIQDIIKEFLFHTEETSPMVASICASKQKITHLFDSNAFCFNRGKVCNFQRMSIPVYKLNIVIGVKHVAIHHPRATQHRAIEILAHNCVECGEYYKEARMYGTSTYYGTPIPDKIVCKCKRKVYHYGIEDFDYR
jgi:hypothetical protein